MAKRKNKANVLSENVDKIKEKKDITLNTSIGTRLKKTASLSAKTESQRELFQSIKKNMITIVAGPPGSGKAQRVSATVMTPNGPCRIWDLKVGDRVSTPDGSYAKVTSLHPQGVKDVYKIYFTDGDTVECCKEHLWLVRDKYWSKKDKFKSNKRLVNNKFYIEKLKN